MNKTKYIPSNPAQGKERRRLPLEERSRQNMPIENTMKSKLVYQTEPIDETCYSYMKLLRETCRTKKVFDIDPYAEVYQLRENVYSILTLNLDGGGDPWMHLIIGPERAMLIDTSFGLGNLKGLVNELTGGMPLIVVNTHGHFDHAYGNCQFDKVYCHKYEVPSLEGQNETYWDYLWDDDGQGIWAEFDRNDLVPFKSYEIVGCEDGTVFNLGGDYEVELVFMGGHTAGSAGFLDKKDRIFYGGDDVLSMRVGIGASDQGNPYGKFATVKAYRDNLEKLSKRLSEFDHVFTGHFVLDLESSVILHLLDACNEILADPEHGYTYARTGKRGTMFYKYVEGLGTIAYRKESIGIGKDI